MPLLIFCNDPLKPRRPDEAYQAEVDAANAVGLDVDAHDFYRRLHERVA